MIVGSRENILHALSYKNVPTQPSKIAHYNFKLVHYCCSGSDAITSARSSRWPAACCRSITSWRWRRRRRFTDECKRDQGRLVVAYDPNRNQIRWVGSGLYTILQPRTSLKFSARSTYFSSPSTHFFAFLRNRKHSTLDVWNDRFGNATSDTFIKKFFFTDF